MPSIFETTILPQLFSYLILPLTKEALSLKANSYYKTFILRKVVKKVEILL